IYDNPEAFSLMLGGLFQERPLAELNARQIDPDSLGRIVPLSEVVEKCGPLIEPGVTLSLGPRPEGWGWLNRGKRILSWRDEGFGLVGDQVNDVDVRFLASESLEEFEDAIIAGPMDEDSYEGNGAVSLPIGWDGEEVDPENLDVESFRRLFLFRQSILKSLDWSHDFELNAYTKEPFQAFLHSEAAEENVEIMCAWATLLVSFGDQEYEDQIGEYLQKISGFNPALIPMTKAMRGVFLWLSAEDEERQTEALNGLEELAKSDKMTAAIHSLLSACPWPEVSPEEAVGLYQSFRPLMRNFDSPYLSWLVEEFCHRMLKNVAGATLDADMDGKARVDILARLVGNGLYDLAIPMLLRAFESENTALLEVMIEKKVHLGGHIKGGNIFVPLASAVMKSNLPVVRLLCQNGADPLEKSHYGGWDSFECLRSLLDEEDCETEEQSDGALQMGDAARNELQTLLDMKGANEDLREIGKILFGTLKER
ncbi:MAG: hypothetical protein VB980_04940, partial [Opitutales bacterium]